MTLDQFMGFEVAPDFAYERHRECGYPRPLLEIWIEFPAGSLALENSWPLVLWITPNFKPAASRSALNLRFLGGTQYRVWHYRRRIPGRRKSRFNA
jgi:hypothetical protein